MHIYGVFQFNILHAVSDRKERKLEFDDIQHYQKIIVALTETDRLMNEINKINIERE